MKALKDNKVYTIDETQKAHYVALGFDIHDDEGNTIAYGQGKTVSYEKYIELENKYKALTIAHEELMAAYEAKGITDELSGMTIEELKSYAVAHNIDLGQATSQDGILKKIRSAQKA